MQVQSIVPGATGTWKITKLTHDLLANALFPGPWQSTIEASPYGN